ncbi:MAG: 3-oxoacyl-ACP reductase family protein [Chloroflexota bacterium]|nr:3-oxoacyl-ACP reductase family protein [Chloroflexota bacterium]
MYDLDNKVAIITGAGGKNGIGRSVATRLAKEGSKIIVTDIVENPYPEEGWNGLSSVVEEIIENGGEAVHILSDVTDFSSINNLIKEAIKKFGRVDILVNNAGATADKDRVPIFDLDENEWDKVIDVNLKGVFLFTKAFSKQLILQNQGGKIINISSIAGKKGSATFGAYNASKAGVIRLTESIALDLAKYNINVNSVCPSWVDTERVDVYVEHLYQDNISHEEKRKLHLSNIESSVPLGRYASSDDVAKAVAFLSSEESSFVTGASLNVSGGIIA